MASDERVVIASEWPSIDGRHMITNSQRLRKQRGKSIYERDRVVKKYDVSKGKYV